MFLKMFSTVLVLTVTASMVLTSPINSRYVRSIGIQIDPILDAIKALDTKLATLVTMPTNVNTAMTGINAVSTKLTAMNNTLLRSLNELLNYWNSHLCPPGFVRNNFSCYRVVTEVLNWQAAQRKCMTYGGRLVSIESPGEQTFVISLIRKAGLQNYNLWTGGSYSSGWVWQPLGDALTYKNWKSGRPSNGNGLCLKTEPAKYGFKWSHHACSGSFKSICEI